LEPYYDAEGITIYHADCRVVLPLLGAFDLLVTDPPYGIGENSKKQQSRGKKAKPNDYGEFDWDQETPPAWLVEQMVEKARHAIVWGGNFYRLPPKSCWLVWDKDNTGDFADCELAWTNLKKAVRKIRYRWNGMLQERMGKDKETRVHPTQKPLSVIEWAIQQAPPECETILDPFMGSGTTLVAARNLGKRAVGIEREEQYCKAAVERLRQGVLPLAL
jgi:DNA modification methylase